MISNHNLTRNYFNAGIALPSSQKIKSPVSTAWRPLSSFHDNEVPAHWHKWLSDRGSLTERLIDASDNQFAVEVLSQVQTLPDESEARALNISPTREVLIRQVILKGKDTPWVFARSILPLTTLTGRLAALRHIDSQPLGAVLFNDPSMSREPVAASYMMASDLHVPESICNQMTHLWGRRSVFRLDSKPLLVSEIFLPSFQDYNYRLEE